MRKIALFSLTGLLLAALLSPSYGFGQDENIDAKDKAKAKKLFKEGVSYFESGKHAQALEAFQKSYKLRPHWAIRFNLGLCYKELGMYTKAKSEFLGFLEEGGSDVNQATEAEVEKELAILSQIIAVIEIDINIDGSEIWMDGKEFATSPLDDKIELDPGSHLLSISKDGYETYEEEFILSKGERKSFKISLLPTKTAPVEGEGGEKEKKKKDKKKAVEEEKEGTKIGGGIETEPKGRKKAWALPVFAATLSLAVASAAAGSAMVAMAYKKKGELDDLNKEYTPGIDDGSCNTDNGCYNTYIKKHTGITDDGKLFATLMIVFYSLAGAAAVGTVVSVVVGHPFARSGVEKKTASFGILPGRNGGTLVLDWSF
jgi:tetratricopeptide (TPR) repeat protein